MGLLDLDNSTLTQIVLTQINIVRAAFRGGPLETIPSGRCKDPEDCPLKWAFECAGLTARIHASVMEVEYLDDAARIGILLGTLFGPKCRFDTGPPGGPFVGMTSHMRELRRRFDDGEIPELIRPSLPALDPWNVLAVVAEEAEMIKAKFGGGGSGGGGTGGTKSRPGFQDGLLVKLGPEDSPAPGPDDVPESDDPDTMATLVILDEAPPDAEESIQIEVAFGGSDEGESGAPVILVELDASGGEVSQYIDYGSAPIQPSESVLASV